MERKRERGSEFARPGTAMDPIRTGQDLRQGQKSLALCDRCGSLKCLVSLRAFSMSVILALISFGINVFVFLLPKTVETEQGLMEMLRYSNIGI